MNTKQNTQTVATVSRTRGAKVKTTVVKSTGPVGIDQAVTALAGTVDAFADNLAQRVIIVGDLVRNNSTESRESIVRALLAKLPTDTGIGRASLLRYATVAEMLAKYSIPVTGEYAHLAYRSIDAGREARAALIAPKSSTPEAFAKRAQRVLAAAGKATASKGKADKGTKAVTSTTTADVPVDVATFVESVKAYAATLTDADALKLADALQDAVDAIHASLTAPRRSKASKA